MADVQNIVNKLADMLDSFGDDITEIHVATYIKMPEGETGSDVLPLEIKMKDNTTLTTNAQLMAYTKLDMDADAILVVPTMDTGDDVTVLNDILKIHNDSVEKVLRARRDLLETILNGASGLLPRP